MLFRVSRGNVIVRFITVGKECTDPETGQVVKKSTFSLLFFGDALVRRIEAICGHFGVSLYHVPADQHEFQSEFRNLDVRLEELNAVCSKTNEEIKHVLQAFADLGPDGSVYVNCTEALRREILVCDALRKSHSPPSSKVVTIEGWVPADLKLELLNSVREQQAIVEYLPWPSQPPTYFRLSVFTSSFQGIVDTYGVPRYQEANPGLFTIITFPFLFGVMYGDIGHGSVLFAFSIWMVYTEKKWIKRIKEGTAPEMFDMLFNGRYLMLLMGFFAVYCGTLYNDCFSIPFAIFPSSWKKDTNNHFVSKPETYPYGVDHEWYHKKNHLAFMNSLKMKMSVTLGVLQMLFGIILSLLNHLHNKDYLSIIGEFVPRFLFMSCTFGYMVFIIILKLFTDWTVGGNPPNLIQTMIQMFLSPGNVEKDVQLYAGQGPFQFFLLIVALICVPWMLFLQPYVLLQREKARQRGYTPIVDGDEDEPLMGTGHSGGDHGHGHGEFSFGNIMIHQSIHVIEFVLGCVSNTASYLRLWALSLAHAQLADVFWEKMIVQYGIDTGSPFFIVVGFGGWLCATTGVLLAMDVLECFLHALRLHWVEFQSKFYAADGYPFEPFTFKEKEIVQ